MDFTDKINATNSKNSFMLHNGIRLTQMEKDYARVEADLTRVNRNLYGAVHGGMFLTMGDCAAGGAARTNGMRYVTVSNSFEFFRNTKSDHLIAEGRIKSRGRTICVAEVEIHDGLGKLLCSGTFTLFCTGKLDELPED
ncbi:PaaI family thioesterase [Evtepia sp.]|uniref:PaaI family thioesterase n=1 Tax=Evtepia sp. TaxID=2773933 RepID=UPI002A827664|nr:PaaI family thioesterase [Evtepia sp.]MDY3992204.1 PaaI family thioesterase [Evtepia sp.]MDY4430661.1 PaaI family thioesterase [Evtepia sp.]